MDDRFRVRPMWPVLIVISSVIPVAGCERSDDTATGFVQKVLIADEAFELELAVDPITRHRGLSGRSDIARDGGMLFVFPKPSRPRFVMRQCIVPIDLLFLDPSGRVVAMHQMQVEPPGTPDNKLTGYVTRWPAQFAVELRDGSIERLAMTLGQKIDLPLDALKRLVR